MAQMNHPMEEGVGRRVRADRRLAVSDHGGPVDTDRVREQQFRVQPRCLEARGAEALGTSLDERSGRGHAAAIRVGS